MITFFDPSNPPLQRTGATVAALPLAPAAERPCRWADGETYRYASRCEFI